MFNLYQRFSILFKKEKVMKVHLYVLALLSLTIVRISPEYCIAQDSSKTPAVLKIVSGVVKELDAAWNARDAIRFSNVFTEDGSFQFPVDGVVMNGREEIKKYYAKLFPSLPHTVKHVTTIKDFHVISPDIIAVDIEVNIYGDSNADSSKVPLYHYLGMGLGVRSESAWHIRLGRVYQMVK
jgi:uncharacterized protein (TIGR02246 family)